MPPLPLAGVWATAIVTESSVGWVAAFNKDSMLENAVVGLERESELSCESLWLDLSPGVDDTEDGGVGSFGVYRAGLTDRHVRASVS